MDTMALLRLKRYMNVDHNDDDDLIPSIWDAACEYLRDAGCGETDAPARFWLAGAALTLFWYENRPEMPKDQDRWPLGLRQLINQLKVKGGVD